MKRANRTVLLVKLVFLGIFAAACAGIWWYQLAVARPRAVCLAQPGAEWTARTKTCRVPPEYACEHGGGWWEPTTRTCARVISIPALTGRPAPAQR